MKKLLLSLFIVLVAFLFLGQLKAKAKTTERFVTWINPVRGKDFWQLNGQEPEDFVFYQRQIAKENDLAITWLIRPDFFLDQELSKTFSEAKSDREELGIFLEVTPTWASLAGVQYHQGEFWSQASSVFLSGYSRKEREKLIRSAFKQFKLNYGSFPDVIGAWHVDPFSAQLINKKYGLKAILICSDQFSTDGYQISGGWWGVPYYPAKTNLLLPADNLSNKLGPIVLWWAQRDPLNGFGRGVKESTYSVQVNDYFLHGLDEKYYHQLVDIYFNPIKGKFGQITLGLENDYRLNKYREGLKNQLDVLMSNDPRFYTVSQFADWYKSQFPELSPAHQIGGEDILGSSTKVIWKMTTDYRKRILVTDGQEILQDYRIYQPDWPDSYTYNQNLAQKLYWNIPAKVNGLNQAGYKAKGKLPFKSSNIWIMLGLGISLLLFFMFKIPAKIGLLIFLCSGVFGLTMFRSGRIYDFGMGFWGPNGHDGIWHLSVMNQVNEIPPQNPVFSGSKLVNYHWGFDFIAGWLGKLLRVSNLTMYFRIMPLILAILIGITSYLLGKWLTDDWKVGVGFAFLNYFAGSFGWIISLIKTESLGGESLFWSMQSISTLINPPYALSLVLIIGGLLLWIKKRQKPSLVWAVVIGLLFSSLSLIKIYAGILIGLAFCLFFISNILTSKQINKFDLVVILIDGVISASFLGLMGIFSHPPKIIFQPLWFPHSLIASLDKLYFPKLACLRQNLVGQWLSWKLPFLVGVEVSLVLIFIIGNLGTRILGLIPLFNQFNQGKVKDFDRVFLLFGLLGLFFPLLFIQKGTAWNTIQFFYYFLIFANFYFSKFLAKLIAQRQYLGFGLILLITLPTTISSLRGYLGKIPPTSIPVYELQALEELKMMPKKVVLTYPYDEYARLALQAPLPLCHYETTAYVSGLSDKLVYLEDEMNLEITGYDWQKRKAQAEKFFNTYDKIWARGFLLENRIDYIYLVNEQDFKLQPKDLGLKQVFNNGQVRIYQVLK